MKREFTARVILDAESKLRETQDGYLVASPRIARTGVQLYSGAEVGRPDLKEVRVYRPEEEVFHVDAISSLAHKPVTDEHPSAQVDATNWRELAVGHLGGDVMRDGDFVRVPLVLMDSDAIKEVRDGKTELSVGYSALLVWGDGTTAKGEKYDATQTEIRANHVAITRAARGGRQLRMGDNRNTKEKKMTTRSFVVDGITVEMEERDMQVVERRINNLAAELTAAQAELTGLRQTSQTELATSRTETANAAAQVQTKDAEIATLKQQLVDSKLKPQDLDRLVADRSQTLGKAKSLIGDALVVEGKTDVEIRRQVVDAKLGDTAKGWNDDMVTASFNTLTSAVVIDDKQPINDFQRLNVVLKNGGGTDPVAKSYSEYEQALTNRWKTAGARQQ
jgi:hypothetical protein